MGRKQWKNQLIITFGLNLLLLLLVGTASGGKGRRINIYGAENGYSDIVQLRRLQSETTPASVFRSKPRRPVYRNALPPNSPLKWSKLRDSEGNYQIPYVITGIYDTEEQAIIKNATETIAANTCIRFIPRTSERDFAEIRNQKGQGCYASIGRFPGRNVVMLESNDDQSCIQHDTVVHELFHVIGLWHEHMRADRDQFISVLYKNIDPGQYPQFEKLSPRDATTYKVPYDYTSVMHYDETAFANAGKISMMTKDSNYQKVIGHPKDASINDYKKVCAIYQCGMCMQQNFSKIIATDGIDMSNYVVTLPPMKMNDQCKDRLAICAMLKTRSMLNCKVMSIYCCSSCSGMTQQDNISTTTVAPIYTPSGLWNRITAIFS